MIELDIVAKTWKNIINKGASDSKILSLFYTAFFLVLCNANILKPLYIDLENLNKK